MREHSLFWLIGYQEDFDFILIGENTGPYSKFPTNKYSTEIEGNFYYIKNFVGYMEGKNLSVTVGSAFSKCPYLDELKRFPELDLPFLNLKDIILSLKEEIVSEATRRLSIKIPMNSLSRKLQ